MEVIHTAEFESPFGAMACASSERGLCFIELPRASGRGIRGWVRRFAPESRVAAGYAPNRAAITQILDYLAGKREEFRLELDLRATGFQIRVYAALLEIPYGERAATARSPRRSASRARRAPSAPPAGANPLPLVVPCHRVVAAHGKLGGFAGGVALKKRLLALEHGRHPSQGELL